MLYYVFIVIVQLYFFQKMIFYSNTIRTNIPLNNKIFLKEWCLLIY